MSDEKKINDDLNERLGNAKKNAKKAAGEAKEIASEFANEAKDAAKEFSDNAKEAFGSVSDNNKKLLAGILAIILGPFGVHKFILGYNKEGIIMLVSTLILNFITCGLGAGLTGIIGLIEGIIYLTKSDEEFHNIYQANKKPWF